MVQLSLVHDVKLVNIYARWRPVLTVKSRETMDVIVCIGFTFGLTNHRKDLRFCLVPVLKSTICMDGLL